jgi:hypothetical protein
MKFREGGMGFLNSLSTRIPLALVGGILYSLLTYSLFLLLGLPSDFAIVPSIIVLVLYVGSRLLILFSGFDSPYYSKRNRKPSKHQEEKDLFYETSQWVGKFYHTHDVVLLAFLTGIAIVFLIFMIIDGIGNKSIGTTLQDLLDHLITSLL